MTRAAVERPATRPVASRHRLDEAALAAWLRPLGIEGIVGGVLGFAAGGLVGAAVGAAAGAAAGDKASDLMNESSERSAADKTRQDAVQKFIRADDRQGAVDEAIKQYGIDVSGVKAKVVYDPSTPGEGETAKDGTVRIGDEAFLSPAWLASSIGHVAQHA